MSKLSNLKSSGGGNREFTGSENVVFQVKGYGIKDPKKPSDEDYIEGILIHDVGNVAAGVDAENNPNTVVKIRYARPVDEKSARRPSVLEYQRGKGNAKPMLPENGALGMATRAYIDGKTGDLLVSWLERWYPEVGELHFPLPNVLASVRPEFSIKREGEPDRAAQNRYVVNPEAAEVFKGLDDFKKKAAAAIDNLGDNPGAHGVIVRIVDLSDNSSVSVEFFEGWDAENNKLRGGAAAVDYFLGNQENADWVEHITSADPDLLFEIIPQLRIGTGSMSLPSALISDKLSNGKEVTDADRIRFDDSIRYRVPVQNRNEYGYAMSHVQVMRKSTEPGTPWFSGGTNTLKASPVLYLREEILTPNLSPATAEKFTADATARKEAVRAARAGNQAADDHQPESTGSMKM